MTKARSLLGLKREATQAMKFRGHKNLRTWHTFTERRYGVGYVAVRSCKDCSYAVLVQLDPMPNEIDLGGEAIALNCLVK
jgi:hypothetical protein